MARNGVYVSLGVTMTRRDLQEVVVNLDYLARIESDPEKRKYYQKWLEAFRRDLQKKKNNVEELTPVWKKKLPAA